jgi:hypothetical protein
MAFRGPSPAQIIYIIVFKHLQMMGNRLPIGICVRNALWDEWQGLFGGFHLSTHDEAPSKVNVFKAFLFTDLKPALA